MHAIVLAVAFGIATTVILVGFGPRIYSALGARNAALDRALAYSNILFGGAIGLWLLGSLTAIVRGAGDMRTPARIASIAPLIALPLLSSSSSAAGRFPHSASRAARHAMLTYYALGVIA